MQRNAWTIRPRYPPCCMQMNVLHKCSTGSYAAINAVWGAVRNIANIAFVIAFLFIIYSQLCCQQAYLSL